MNKKISIIIGGTLLVSCLFANGIFNLQNQGNTVKKILATSVTKDNYFIIPDSSTRYLTTSDLQGLSLDELEIARNEIYARHGYQFQQQKMIDYFNNQSWYTRSDHKITTDDLSKLEYANVMLIKNMEDNYGSNSNYAVKDGFIIPDSSTRYLTEDDLIGLSKEQLEIARNEIYARHGYIFVSDEWKDFFINEDWYTPTTSSVTLNSIEEYNVGMILEEESNR